jgi:hypothetical protein
LCWIQMARHQKTLQIVFNVQICLYLTSKKDKFCTFHKRLYHHWSGARKRTKTPTTFLSR